MGEMAGEKGGAKPAAATTTTAMQKDVHNTPTPTTIQHAPAMMILGVALAALIR
jgi:hypothetical protein